MKTINRFKIESTNLLNTVILFAAITFVATSCLGPAYVTRTEVRTIQQPAPQVVVVEQPEWAPPCENVQTLNYYYIPDLEVYYDIRAREYVYIDNGNWIFSSYLPPMYSNYNLNDAFVVVLDQKVHQPWRSHNLYVSHYPRYYYKSKYREGNTEYDRRGVRGYNENRRTVVYRDTRQPERREAAQPVESRERRDAVRPVEHNERRSENNNNQTQMRRESERNNVNTTKPEERRNTQETRSTENNRNQGSGETKTEERRRSVPAEYDNKKVGNPVKVERSMRRSSENSNTKKADTKSSDSKKTDTNNSNGSRR